MIALFSAVLPSTMIQDAFAASGISSAVADDPDDADAVYSTGDTIVITFPAQVNATFASGTMTNAEFRANFTVSNSDIDTADTVSGVWNAAATALTITIDTIAGGTPPVINTDTVAYDTINGNIGYNANNTHFIGTTVTLTGDFGLFVADTTSNSNDCYDCIPPKLQETQIAISSNNPLIITDDDLIHITANIGDKVAVILNVTDNKPVDDFRFAGLYTNYQDTPSDMNAFYANNYDNLKQVSTSFYEWNIRSDDTAYDYDGTLSWSTNIPQIVMEEVNSDNFKFKNDDNVVQYFMMPFTFTINEHMDSTQIVAKVYDGAYNRLHVTLPVVLDVSGNDPLNFENLGKQKVLGFFDEAVLIQSISDWDDSQDNTEKLAQLLGVSKDSIPLWTLNLAKWVSEGKIDSANLIVAVEYMLNQ